MQEPIIDIEHEEIDLLAEMAKATEYKPEAIAIEQIATATDNTANDSDFEPAPEPEATESTTEDTNNINAEDLTDLIIDASDMVLESVLPWMYRKTIDKKELQLMNEIKSVYKQAKANKKTVIEFTPEQQATMDIYIDYADYVEDLPLTTKEKKNLREPLRKVLANVNFKASPENALMAVAAMILLPRALPIITNKFANSKKHEYEGSKY